MPANDRRGIGANFRRFRTRMGANLYGNLTTTERFFLPLVRRYRTRRGANLYGNLTATERFFSAFDPGWLSASKPSRMKIGQVFIVAITVARRTAVCGTWFAFLRTVLRRKSIGSVV
jgi:hypothetical protein